MANDCCSRRIYIQFKGTLIFQLTHISITLFITTFLNLIATFISWQRRKSSGGYYIFLGMLSITIWTLAAGLDYASVPVSLKVFFTKIEYLGYNSALVFLTLFTLVYIGREDWLKKRWVQVIFVFIPVSNILLAWTNELHGLLWSDFLPSEFGNNVVIFVHGPMFAWVAISGYAMILVMVGNLWQASRRGSDVARRQGRWLFLASLVPVLSNLIYLLNIAKFSGVDWSSITFSISAMFFLLALYGTRLLDIVPIARYTIIEQMGDPILVLDFRNQVVDFNLAAKRVFNLAPVRLETASVHEMMAAWPGIVDLVSRDQQSASGESLRFQGEDKVFDIYLTPLLDSREQVYGRLIVFRDITQQFQVEQALMASEERYRTVADYTHDWGYWLSPDGELQYMSPSCEQITGYTPGEFLRDPKLLDTLVLLEDQSALVAHHVLAQGQRNVQHNVDFRIRRKDGQVRWISHACRHIQKVDGTDLGLRVTNRDITDRKHMEEFNLFRAKLWEYAASHSFKDLIQMAMNEICSLAESPVGFYCFTEEDPKTVSLHAWAPRGSEILEMASQELHYRLDEVGLWGQAFYQQTSVICNDCISFTQAGMPAIHVELVRAFVVPVIRGGQVAALLTLGNKTSDYTQGDIELASNLAIITWAVGSQKLAEEKLRQAQTQLAEQQSELARSEERQRMARDLHDSVNQSIHSMVLFSETLAATLEKKNYERAGRLIERLQESARQSLKETRLLLYELQSDSPDEKADLIQDLEARLSTVERRAGIKVQFTHDGVLEHCPSEWYTNLYWIVIEALNNALKHAQAREVRVVLHCSVECVELEVSDNGIGFDPDKVGKGGMGLGNMRARAKIMGGTLNIISSPKNGTRVRFFIIKSME